MPSYNHGSEVEALTRAGIVPRFYMGNESLEPQEDELEKLAGPRTKALYLIHYLGFPQEAARWRAWCDGRELFLIEDAAQSWLASVDGEPVGSLGELSIFCMYKTFGIPDGAALMMRGATPPLLNNRGPLNLNGLVKRNVAWLEGRYSPWASVIGATRKEGEYDPVADFALGDPTSTPGRSTLWTLSRICDAAAATRRRANYRILLEELRELVLLPFDEVPSGASPFAFPITVPDREAMAVRLREQNIAGMSLWSVAHSAVETDADSAIPDRRERTLALPVHQELRARDLERIVEAVRGRRTGGKRHVTESHGSPAGLETEWSVLAEHSRNVFSTWEWASVWSKHFLAARPVSIELLRDADGRVEAIFPLYLWSESFPKTVRFLGHGPGDQMGPVCAPEVAPRASLALRNLLRDLPWKWDVFVGDYLPREQEWRDLLGGHSLRRFESPVLNHDGTWDDFMRSRSANFREQVKRRERGLRKRHDLAFRLSKKPDLERDLNTLFDLYDARWSEGERAFSRQRAFHTDFARIASQKGWLRLWFLELDERPVAAWYGFRYAGVESFYQAGRDPKFADESVGFVLLTHTIREALDDGVKEYRFLRGGEGYKYRFATQDHGVETLAIASSPLAERAVRALTAVGEWGPARKVVGRRLARLTGT